MPPHVARALLDRALRGASQRDVPEDPTAYRSFLEGTLAAELERVLDATEIAQILDRLGHVVWTVTRDASALDLASRWSAGHLPSTGRHRRVGTTTVTTSDMEAVSDRDAIAQRDAISKKDTIRPPGSNPPARISSSVPAPGPRATSQSGVSVRAPLRPPAVPLTSAGVPGEPGRPHGPLSAPRSAPAVVEPQRKTTVRFAAPPSALIVVSLDPSLAQRLEDATGGRCPLRVVTSPAELARAATRNGDRLVVLVDTLLPAIDLATFVGLAPILPRASRVVLWGMEEAQRRRFAAEHAAAASWSGSTALRDDESLLRAVGLG